MSRKIFYHVTAWWLVWLGFALRIQQLAFQPLWGDEGWSFYFIAQSWPNLVALTALDIHPPLYYALLKIWLNFSHPTPENARFFSVITGTLLLPAIYRLGRHLFSPQVGLMALAISTVMPMAVYYAQEVRMYGLVTLLAVSSTYFFARLLTENSRRANLGYILSTTAAMYTMYYAIFLPLYQLLYVWIAQIWLKHKEPIRWKPFISRWVAVSLLYLPWLIYATPRLLRYIANKRAVEGYTPLSIFDFLAEHLSAFSMGHLPPMWQSYSPLALIFLLIALLGLRHAWRCHSLHAVLLCTYLSLPLLMGFLINQRFPFTPPTYERTLLLAAPAFWLMLALGVQAMWQKQPHLTVMLTATLATLWLILLSGFFYTPRYQHEDYRPLLADIAARATPADTLLASYQWQYGFYWAYLTPPRPRLFTVPEWGQGWDAAESGQRPQMTHDLTLLLQQTPRLWFPAHQAAGHIWEDAAEQQLSEIGYPTLLEWYTPQTKFLLTTAPPNDMVEQPSAHFDTWLTLSHAAVGTGAYQAGREAIPVALTWQVINPPPEPYRVSLRLADEEGRTWSIRDSYPQGGQARFADISANQPLRDKHGLLVSAGTPPATYRLLLSVRRVADAKPLDLRDDGGQPLGVEWSLGTVSIIEPQPPVGAAALPYQTALTAQFGDEVRLVGYTLPHAPFKAGETLPLTLFWQGVAHPTIPLITQLQLVDKAGQVVASYEQPPIQPTTSWQAGTVVRDPYEMPLPSTLPPDEYSLQLLLLTPELSAIPLDSGGFSRWYSRSRLPLRKISTVDRPHEYEPPTPTLPLSINFSDYAEVVGLSMPDNAVIAGEILPLTLHWRANQPFERNWQVFMHVVDGAGNIIAQQDQTPGAGEFPTLGWLPNEYIADSYQLQIPATATAGEYHLRFGLYDVNDFSRLPIIAEGSIQGDHVDVTSWSLELLSAE